MSILKAAQRELSRHSWEHFVDNPPSIAQGGNGVVVPGCPACSKTINTTNGFIEHLANDVLPGILETAVSTATKFVEGQKRSAKPLSAVRLPPCASKFILDFLRHRI
jgi:hypothetical protein